MWQLKVRINGRVEDHDPGQRAAGAKLRGKNLSLTLRTWPFPRQTPESTPMVSEGRKGK